MKLGSLGFVGTLVLSATSLPLQAFTSPTATKGGGQRLTGALVLQDATYETDDDFDVEGELLAVGYKTAVNSQLSLGGGLALLLDGEMGEATKIGDGSGFRLQLDGDYEVKAVDKNRFFLTFGLIHDRFSFEEGNVEADFTMTDIKLGGLMAHAINSQFSLYGGLDIFVYSDGDVEVLSTSVEAERESRINLRLGAAFAIDSRVDLRADLLLIGEQTVTLAADISI